MRKEAIITLQDTDYKGNPIEVSFKVRQMSALQQERWINRVLLLVLKNGEALKSLGTNITDIKSKIEGNNGIENIIGIFRNLEYEQVEPLYDELLTCCSHIPDINQPNMIVPCTTSMIDTVISDYRNLYRLRKEALKINFNFFGNGASSQGSPAKQIVIAKNM